MQTEYKAGQAVYIMRNNQPVQTRIRAVKYVEALEVSRDGKTGEETESVNSSCVYSTLLTPNDPLPGTMVGNSKEELLSKIFKTDEPVVKSSDTKSKSVKAPEEKTKI